MWQSEMLRLESPTRQFDGANLPQILVAFVQHFVDHLHVIYEKDDSPHKAGTFL